MTMSCCEITFKPRDLSADSCGAAQPGSSHASSVSGEYSTAGQRYLMLHAR